MTDLEKDQLNMQLIIIEEFHNKFSMPYKEIATLFLKYNLFDYIDVCYDIFNSKSIDYILSDLKAIISQRIS